MSSINTLRAILTVGAFVAAVVCLAMGQVSGGLALMVAVAVHSWMFWFQHKRGLLGGHTIARPSSPLQE